MKKLVALLLACAMVISCVSMVSLFVGAEGESEWSDNLLDENSSTFEGVELNAEPDGFGKLQTALSVIQDPADEGNKVLKATTAKEYSTPKFPCVVEAAKAIVDANEWKKIDIRVSGKVLLAKGGAVRVTTRQVGGTTQTLHFGMLTDLAAETWTTFDFVYTLGDTDATWTAEDPWALAFDSMKTNNGSGTYMLLDDISIQVRKWVPEPVKMVNGDVELGTTEGWAAFASGKGTLTVVEGGANDTAHAMKFTPNATSYASVGFLLGAAVINDPEAGYFGGGAGDYTVTFYAKAAEGKGGKFNMLFNSQWHKSKGAVIGDYTLTDNTYITKGSKLIEMTDEWQKFEITINVSEEFHDNLVAAFAAGAPATAYDLILRFDGSSLAYANVDERFDYYVDEVTVEKYVEPEESGDGEEVKQLPGGVRFTVVLDDAQLVLKTGTGVLSAANVKDDQVTVSFPITNESDVEMIVELALQTTANTASGGKTWAGPDNHYERVTIAPGETEIIEYTMDVENGQVEVLDEMYDLSTFFLRFNILQDGSKAVDAGVLKFVIGANADSFYDKVLTLKSMNNGGGTATAETVLTPNGIVYNPNAGAATGDVMPVALIAILAVAVAALTVVVIRKKKEQ